MKVKGFGFSNTANIGKSWFGSDASKLLRFQSPDGRSVTMGLDADNASLKPRIKGDTVTYQDAANGADLEYKVGRGQVKENIVLDRAPVGPVSYTFTLDTAGLTPKARKDGSVALFGELPNSPVMVIPAPYMTDAKEDALSPTGGIYSTKVAQRLTRDGDKWQLTVTPDTKWLAAKERQYPVAIDPTITIAPDAATSQDTMEMSTLNISGPSGRFSMVNEKSVGDESKMPTFSMVLLEGAQSSLEVPLESVGHAYWAAEDLETVDIGGTRFVRLGYTGASGAVLLNTVTGAVVESNDEFESTNPVNSSLRNFTACIQAVIERFPFYSQDAGEEEWESAADDVLRLVREVDPEAFVEGGYWHEMTSDIMMGDYATESVLDAG
ncbi:SUKH-4 family immunity protein [Streptomyces sp. NBC_01669]|uniref:SUKH-4 family immunity protein n=1 Tax=Streptomyces sp. NBC_01669 TaxID=2975909 RepID=UPI00224F9C40|nr:SUKH-4 family immunity protein [Streptomyces sp. NBC_01669]MCX4537548.1 SUKH-4 family immunity protein [Streptomyces sp. NBC_01669]